MPAPDLIAGHYNSQGILVGLRVDGFVVLPFSLGTGIAMQDSAGQFWLLTIGTDGRLNTDPITF